jgi:2-methylaconitate cis-trans-isomerase PrpF
MTIRAFPDRFVVGIPGSAATPKAWAERVTVYRTARQLMEGFVRVP